MGAYESHEPGGFLGAQILNPRGSVPPKTIGGHRSIFFPPRVRGAPKNPAEAADRPPKRGFFPRRPHKWGRIFSPHIMARIFYSHARNTIPHRYHQQISSKEAHSLPLYCGSGALFHSTEKAPLRMPTPESFFFSPQHSCNNDR